MLTKTKTLLAAAMLAATPLAIAETASETDNLLQTLINKGVLTAEEAAAIKAKAKDDATNDESKPVGKRAVPLNAKHEMGYLVFESEDGSTKYWLDGRIMLDTGSISNSQDDNRVYSETEFRRLRLAVKGKFYKDWEGELDIDFADLNDGDSLIEVKDAWMAYNGFENTIIKLGNHKPFYSMDEVTTSRWVNTIERSMVSDVFSPGRRIALSASHFGEAFVVGATLFGDEYNVDNSGEGESERLGWTARGVYRPIVADNGNEILHLGLNMKYQPPQSDDGDRLRFRTRPEVRNFTVFGPDDDDGSRYLNTGRLDADSYDSYGLEFAYKNGAFYAQSEYHVADVDVIGGPDAEFSGYYLNVAYFLSGGQREYSMNDGEFGKVFPTDKEGAWEVVARFSNIDLNDLSAGIEGGSADVITLGLNWYVNNNFVMRANYTMADHDVYADGDGDFVGDDDIDALGLRFQYLF